jgi:SAM-dependent methyltransferase
MPDAAGAVLDAAPEASESEDLRGILHRHVSQDCRTCYGDGHDAWVDRAVDNWLDYRRNYDGRWSVILDRGPNPGRMLDMAAGVGTFMLYGLLRGHDVHGVEPEAWKRRFFERQVADAGLPDEMRERLHDGVGESLPFDDDSFDFVSTYQTLEHVDDPELCVREMLRVLRPGGVLYLKAPDYRCIFEPHYRLPFLPCMNRRVAKAYLRCLGRPVLGLDMLQWTTRPRLVKAVRDVDPTARIERVKRLSYVRREEKIRARLPRALRRAPIIRGLNRTYELRFAAPRMLRVATARQERNVDLWITTTGA